MKGRGSKSNCFPGPIICHPVSAMPGRWTNPAPDDAVSLLGFRRRPLGSIYRRGSVLASTPSGPLAVSHLAGPVGFMQNWITSFLACSQFRTNCQRGRDRGTEIFADREHFGRVPRNSYAAARNWIARRNLTARSSLQSENGGRPKGAGCLCPGSCH